MITNFRFMQWFWLEHNDLNLCKYLVTLYDSFEYGRILLVLKFCGKIVTSLP